MDDAKLKKAFEIATSTVAKAKQAETNVQLALRQLKDIAESPTFTIDDVYYQIRERKGVMYLCTLKGKPLGRPKGKSSKSEVAIST